MAMFTGAAGDVLLRTVAAPLPAVCINAAPRATPPLRAMALRPPPLGRSLTLQRRQLHPRRCSTAHDSKVCSRRQSRASKPAQAKYAYTRRAKCDKHAPSARPKQKLIHPCDARLAQEATHCRTLHRGKCHMHTETAPPHHPSDRQLSWLALLMPSPVRDTTLQQQRNTPQQSDSAHCFCQPAPCKPNRASRMTSDTRARWR